MARKTYNVDIFHFVGQSGTRDVLLDASYTEETYGDDSGYDGILVFRKLPAKKRAPFLIFRGVENRAIKVIGNTIMRAKFLKSNAAGYDDTAAMFPNNTMIQIIIKKAFDDHGKVISEFPIAPWNMVSFDDQADIEKQAQIKLPFNGVLIRQYEALEFWFKFQNALESETTLSLAFGGAGSDYAHMHMMFEYINEL